MNRLEKYLADYIISIAKNRGDMGDLTANMVMWYEDRFPEDYKEDKQIKEILEALAKLDEEGEG